MPCSLTKYSLSFAQAECVQPVSFEYFKFWFVWSHFTYVRESDLLLIIPRQGGTVCVYGRWNSEVSQCLLVR